MKIKTIDPQNDIENFQYLIEKSFSNTPDSSIDKWLSFPYIKQMMQTNRGFGLKALDGSSWVGAIYAQQENPVNGKEGEEKWVIMVAGVDPDKTGQGIGTRLLEELEKLAKQQKVKKLFTFTNKGDDKVIDFYRNNGYEDAGWVKDYQYGTNNSAVFLLKYIG